MAQVSHGPDVLPVTNSVKALEETQSTDPNQWPGFNLSSSTTGLLTDWALLSLCQLADASSRGSCACSLLSSSAFTSRMSSAVQ